MQRVAARAEERVGQVDLGIGRVEADGLLRARQDDRLGRALDQIAQGRRGIGHGVRAVADDEAVVPVIARADGPRDLQPVGRAEIRAVEREQLQALHPAQRRHRRDEREQLLARQLRHQPLRRLSGRDGPAGADHKDLFHGRLLHVFIFSILSYPN